MARQTLIALNRSERGSLPCEGYVGPINQPHVLTFDGAVTAESMREALWQLTVAWPRLRAIVVPTWRDWALEIIPLDRERELRQLLAQAFRVWPGGPDITPEALRALHQDELNTPLCLERGLPWRAWFVPHPSRPVLVFNVHHVVGDGHSMYLMHQSLLQCLQGQPLPSQPVTSGSQWPALRPARWWHWPASVAAAWRNGRRDTARRRGHKVLRLATREGSPRFTLSALRHATLPMGLAEAKALARRHGATINVLMAALLAQAMFVRRAPQLPPGARPVVDLRVAVDLRRFFPEGQAPRMGNCVANVTLRALPQPDMAAQLADLREQSAEQLGRLARRELALVSGLQEGLRLVGRRLLSKLMLHIKEGGRMVMPSVFISNLGPADGLTPPDARVRLHSLWTTSIGVTLFVSVASLNDRFQLVFTWQCDDTETGEVEAFIEEVARQCASLAQAEAGPPAAVLRRA